MESTTQNRTWFPLSLLLYLLFSPLLILLFFFFLLNAFKHRYSYKGAKPYSKRYSYFKYLYLLSSQFKPIRERLESYELLTRKDTFIFIYSKCLKWELLSLPFLLSSFYKKEYQKARIFKLCFLSSKLPFWILLLSPLEPLVQMPKTEFLKELDHPILCFSDSLTQLRELALGSYKNVVFFKLENFFSWRLGYQLNFLAIGSLSSKERLKSAGKTELKLDKLLARY